MELLLLILLIVCAAKRRRLRRELDQRREVDAFLYEAELRRRRRP